MKRTPIFIALIIMTWLFAAIMVMSEPSHAADVFTEATSADIIIAPVGERFDSQRMEVTGWLSVTHGDPQAGSGLAYYYETLLQTDDGKAFQIQAPLTEVQGYHGKRVQMVGTTSAQATTIKEASLTLIPERVTVLNPEVSGVQAWVNILCRFSDSTGTTPQQPSYFQDLMSNVYPRMDAYFTTTSYNIVDTQATAVTTWVNLPQPLSYYTPGGNADLTLMTTDCVSAANSQVFFPSYDGINMMFNVSFGSFAYGGGRTINVDGQSKFYRTTWLPPWGFNSLGVTAHEMGHGYGWPHSSGPYGLVYDSSWDVMSDVDGICTVTFPSYGCVQVGTIAYHLDLVDWLPDSRKITVNTNSESTATLTSLTTAGSNSNTMMFVVPIAGSSSRYYTVEARTFDFYDQNIPLEGVVIHEVVLGRTEPARVVDATVNSNPNDAGAVWVAGETFYDTASDISIEVLSRTGDNFSVRVRNALGTMIPINTYQDSNTTFFTYTGTWSTVNDANASGGTLQRTTQNLARVNFKMVGATSFTIYRTTAAGYGNMEVCIGASCQIVSNATGSTVYQNPVSFTLADTNLKNIEVRNLSGGTLDFDAVMVSNYVTLNAADSAGLISAITTANADTFPNIIVLNTSATYNLSAAHNTDWGLGGNALPSINNDANGVDIIIEGNGATINRSGASNYRLLHVSPDAELLLKNVTISNGRTDQYGGAILVNGTLTTEGVTFTNNVAGLVGGGIFGNLGTAVITINNSTFNGNQTTSIGGSTPSAAGAIYSNNIMTITNSTFSGNIARGSGSTYSPGGAVYSNYGMTVSGSTFTNNTGSFGSALYFGANSVVTNSTFSGNTASGGGGTIYSNNNFSLRHITSANNTAGWGYAFQVAGSGSIATNFGNLFSNGSGSNCSIGTGASVTSQGYNLSQGTGCGAFFTGTGDGNNITLALDALANNGGTTQTHLPQAGNPAIDRIPGASCTVTSVDQRGTARPQGANCDSGAVEVLASIPPAVTVFAPTGHVPVATPTFAWTEATGGTWYQLWLVEADGTSGGYWGEVGAGITCASGDCNWVSPVNLDSFGLHQYWIQHYGAYGYGAWSAAGYFVRSQVPAAPVPNNPTGTITTANPSFTWAHVPAAEWYYLWVSNSSTTVHSVWYNAYSSICDFGTNNCGLTPTLNLTNGAHTWWLQAWSPIGYGDWSAGQNFTVSLAPTVAPELAPMVEIVPMIEPAAVEPIQIELP